MISYLAAGVADRCVFRPVNRANWVTGEDLGEKVVCDLKARYQGRYLNIAECAARAVALHPAARKPVRKDHNAGGKSSWMQGLFDRPSPPLWRLIQNE